MTEPTSDTIAQTHAAPKARLPRWAKYALFVSLALNVLFVGLFAGAAARGWQGGGHGGGRGNANIIGYVASLPPADRKKLFANFKDLREQLRPLREAARDAGRERIAALTAEPFDKQRYLAAQTRQIEAETKVRMTMRDLVADAAANMTLEQRKGYVRWRGPRQMPMFDDDGLDERGKGGKRMP